MKHEAVLEALSSVQDPGKGRDIVSLGYVQDLRVDGGKVRFRIQSPIPPGEVRDHLREAAHEAVSKLSGVTEVGVVMTSLIQKPERTASPQETVSPSSAKERLIPNVKSVIPVASGKGGVGKSTVSVNLALALAHRGARVGIMDADVYGPTIPTLLGIAKQPDALDDHRLIPVEQYGLKVMSMGFFLKEDDAVVWRGPMLHKAIEQFLGGVAWEELDYLIVDLPPGTGDIQLSLCQTIPLTGAVIVSTPQDVALRVAQKAIAMFHKLNAPILGMIENMSHFICSHCGKREDIFGTGGARKAAERLGIPFLGEIPLATPVRVQSDEGKPIVISDPNSPVTQAFIQAAEKLAEEVKSRDKAPELPDITRPDAHHIRIQWKDGYERLFPVRELRLECPCAGCLDEMTGKRRFDPATIPPDVHPLHISLVGNYAINIRWSDGHQTGIYSFTKLRGPRP